MLEISATTGITIGDIATIASFMVMFAGIVGQWAVNKYKVKQLEIRRIEDKEDLKSSIDAVNLSKSNKFKIMREDINDKLIIVHKRIDTAQADIKESNRKLESKMEKLGTDIKDGNKELLNTITLLINQK